MARGIVWILSLILFACVSSYAQDSDVVKSMARGKSVYEQACLACHQADGSGVPFLAPPLIEGVFVAGDKKKLIEIVLNGLQGIEIKGETYANPMPAFDYLSDQEIADVLTYLRKSFKNNADPVVEADVKAARPSK